LAPGETFRPWYTRNATYVRNLNRGNVGRGGMSVTITNTNNDRANFANARPFDEQRGRWARGNDRGNDSGFGRNVDPRGREDRNRIVITNPPATTPQAQAPAQPGVQTQDNGRGGRPWSGRDFRRPNGGGYNGGQTNAQNGGAPLQIAPTLQTPNAVTSPPNPVTQAPQLGAPTFAAPDSDAARMERRARGSRPPPMPDPNGDSPRFQPRAAQQPQPNAAPNVGPNIGQGNVGEGNVGQGNLGAPAAGDPAAQPPGGGGRGPGRGGFGRNRDNN
jgi:hypothetical protein